MNLSPADAILNAAEHIPEGATLIVPEVWRYDGQTVRILTEHLDLAETLGQTNGMRRPSTQ